VGASLKVYLLGRFEAVRADAPIPAAAWRRRRPADLLKLLALTPGRALSREAVMDALWPDKDPASGANNLHRALYDLRQVLGGRFVDVDHGTVRLRADVWVDADQVEQAVRQGGLERLRTAVALYRGDLSPEDPESPWLVPHRRRLRERFVEAAHPVVREAALAGDLAQAVPLLRRLLAADPASEEAHRLLMRLLAETGRRAEALAQYQACAAGKRLAGLGPPGLDTEALRDDIERGEIGPVRGAGQDGLRGLSRRLLGTDEPPPLRGREGVLPLVETVLDRGHGVVVLLGEGGVGTTRVAVEGARLAQARGYAVLGGQARPGLAPPGALFEGLLAAERRAHPDLPDPFREPASGLDLPADQVRRRLFDGVRDAIAGAAEGRPVYLLLDDLHEADPTSHNLLHFLARRAAALGLVVVATCREEAVRAGAPVQTALTQLDTERLARGLRVPRLALAGTRAQLADLAGGGAADALAAAVHRTTDGRPAWVEAVVTAWRQTGLVAQDPQAAVRAVLALLPPAGEALLAAAAVMGRRFDVEPARAAAGLDVRAGLAGLEAVAAMGLVDDVGDGFRFHAAMAHEAVLSGLPSGRRLLLHRAVADALEAASRRPGAEPASEPVAFHRLQGGQRALAVPHLLAAGHRAAARTGLFQAASLLDQALAIADEAGLPLGPARAEALDALGRARLGLGDLPALGRVAEAAARGDAGGPAPVERRARARRWAALARLAAGDLEEALAQAGAGLEELGAAEEDEGASLAHLRAQLLWHAGRFAPARAAALEAAALAERLGDALLASRGRDLAALAGGMLGLPAPPPGDPPGAAERRRPDRAPEHLFDPHLVLWERDLVAGWAVDDLARAAGLHAARAAARGHRDALAVGRTGEGLAALAAGRVDAAEPLLREAVALHREAGSALGEALALERLGAALVARGALPEALEALGDGVVAAERGGLRRHAVIRLHASLARAWLAAGDATAAEATSREAAEGMEEHGDCLVCEAALRPELVRVALARGRRGPAAEEAAALSQLAERRGGPFLRGVAALARARVAAEGSGGGALPALAEAREAFLRCGAWAEAARAARLAARLRGAPPDDPALDALLRCDADA
jgi:DNA-binding SARP family transcriptional activator